MKIVGIDPGSGIIGFGFIELTKNTPKLLDAGVIRTVIGDTVANRLADVYDSLQELLAEHKPDIAVVEKLFFRKT